ncbi:MAG: M48 family metallopeptidase [Burkholderiales bacterium]|nr:M48 family metallopeptidase [Burkholderiales bacterium]
MNAVSAKYFDGKSSRLHQVRLTVLDGIAHIDEIAGFDSEPGISRSCAITQLRVSERTRHAPRKITFPDGAFLEINDQDAFNTLLKTTGYQDSLVVRLQQSWRGALLALLSTVAILIVLYFYGLPVASRYIAYALPVSFERKMGDGMLAYLDKHAFEKSALSDERQHALQERFQAMRPPLDHSPDYQLVFRKSKIGPNAFALPSGDIIVTDEIIKLMNDDNAVMGILAHELGHLHRRHLTQRIIQSSAIAAVVTLVFGDVSAVIANIPTLLLDLKYSRDAETEADDYALAMLDQNGISPDHLAIAFEKLDKLAPGVSSYLSSHPDSKDRAKRMRTFRPSLSED